jgi:hypothetical protein
MKILILFIVTLLSIISCRKDDFEATQIIIGNHNTMLVTNHDTTISVGYQACVKYNLDIDEDGVNDFMIESEIWGSPGIGMHPRSKIKSLHSKAEFFGVSNVDTLFLNRDTIYYPMVDNVINVSVSNNYTCQSLSVNDSILNVEETTRIKTLENNDILTNTDSFILDAHLLGSDNYIIYQGDLTINDTIYHAYNNYYEDCYNFPFEQITYIGIRLNETKLGWIKIAVYENFKVNIIETAITK